MPLVVLLASAALAMPLGSPVATDEHGLATLSLDISGEGDPGPGAIENLRGVPTKSLRLDLVPIDHLGVFGDAAVTTVKYKNGDRDEGWSLGGGVRATGWFTPSLALAGVVDAEAGRTWTNVGTGEPQDPTRRLTATAAPVLVFGQEGGGAYAWLGPSADVRGEQGLGVGEGGMAWDRRHLGVVMGAELASSDLRAYGESGALYVKFGVDAHFADWFGMAVRVGVGF